MKPMEFQNTDEIWKKFNTELVHFLFEGRHYTRVQCRKWLTYQIYLFHCEEERHYIKVKMDGQRVERVYTYYSIGGAAI